MLTNADIGSALRYVDLGHCKLAYRMVGSGPPLLMVHGYPLSGLTFRHIAPGLADKFTCFIPDLPGLGETRWTEQTDFNFSAQAETLRAFVDSMGLSSYSIIAHDTGATIARRLSLIDASRVTKMVLIGTEIPEHRPPWIPFFQKIGDPKKTGVFKFLMSKRWFRQSSAGFGGTFKDLSLIEGEFYDLFIAPVLASDRKISGGTRFLLGIDWALVDDLKRDHAKIKAPVLLVWGEEDTVFPVKEARAMAAQLGDCRGFVTVPGARLFVQEEKPEAVTKIARDFLLNPDGMRTDAPSIGGGLSAMTLRDGEISSPSTWLTINGTTVAIPDKEGAIINLQFSRWAGCPICNLHLASYKARAADLERAGVKVVIVFHSPSIDIEELRGDLPFALVADPERRYYRAFGVGRSLKALLNRQAFASLRREARQGRRAERIHGGVWGLPADFMIDPKGKVIVTHRGQHADDNLGVEDVLRLANTSARPQAEH